MSENLRKLTENTDLVIQNLRFVEVAYRFFKLKEFLFSFCELKVCRDLDF